MPSPALEAALERSRRLGAFGPGPIADHIAHSAAFVQALEPIESGGVVLDLGSGGGLPGLVLIEARPDLQFVLLDAMEKRTALLVEAVAALGATARCQVITGRAEEVGRSELRGTAAAVTARSFGPPGVTAECAAPFLRVGGRLIVSEPPKPSERWPMAGVQVLGLALGAASPGGVQVLEQRTSCPEAYPRRNGIPAKRPLF